MTNQINNVQKEEEVKESRFKKHVRKHKAAYTGIVGTGVGVISTKLAMEIKLKVHVARAFELGAHLQNEYTWSTIKEKIQDGVLKMEMLKDDDSFVKENLEKIAEMIKSEGE